MLIELARIHNRKTYRASSWDTTGRNNDAWTIPAGETAVLADIRGPACITHIWMTQRNHYRECLLELNAESKTAPVKIVDRIHESVFHFRTIKSGSGFYLGTGPDLLFFPMPSLDDLHTTYYGWWRSAQM